MLRARPPALAPNARVQSARSLQEGFSAWTSKYLGGPASELANRPPQRSKAPTSSPWMYHRRRRHRLISTFLRGAEHMDRSHGQTATLSPNPAGCSIPAMWKSGQKGGLVHGTPGQEYAVRASNYASPAG